MPPKRINPKKAKNKKKPAAAEVGGAGTKGGSKHMLQKAMYGVPKIQGAPVFQAFSKPVEYQLNKIQREIGVYIPVLLFVMEKPIASSPNPIFAMIDDPTKSIEFIDAQVQKQLVMLKQTNHFGVLPLHYAAYKGRSDVVAYLLDNGAADQLNKTIPPQIVNQIKTPGLTPLMIAVLSAKAGVVQTIADYIATNPAVRLDVNGTKLFDNRQSLLHAAVILRPSLVEPLIELGANVKGIVDQGTNEYSVIETALRYSTPFIVGLLLGAGAHCSLELVHRVLSSHHGSMDAQKNMLSIVMPHLLTSDRTIIPFYHGKLSVQEGAFLHDKWKVILSTLIKVKRERSIYHDMLMATLLNDIDWLTEIKVSEEYKLLDPMKQSTVIAIAASAGNVAMAEILIEDDFGLNTQCELGQRPITLAVAHDQTEAVALMLKHGVELNFQIESINTAFIICLLKTGIPEIIKLVLSSIPADELNKMTFPYENEKEIQQKTLLEMFFLIDRSDKAQLLEILIELGMILSGAPLSYSAYEMVRVLEESPEKSEMMMLLLNYKPMQQLQRVKANVKGVVAEFLREEVSAAEMAGAGAEVDGKDVYVQVKTSLFDTSVSAVHMLCLKNDLESVNAYLEMPSGLVTMRDNYAETPLHFAVRAKAYDVMERLIKHPNCELDTYSRGAHTPLHLAIVNQDKKALMLLVNATEHRYAIDLNQRLNMKSGETLLHVCAMDSELHELVPLFADMKINWNAVNDAGETALMYAIQCEHLAAAKVMLENGANPYLVSREKYTAQQLFDIKYVPSEACDNPLVDEVRDLILCSKETIADSEILENFGFTLDSEALKKEKKRYETLNCVFQHMRYQKETLEDRYDSLKETVATQKEEVALLDKTIKQQNKERDSSHQLLDVLRDQVASLTARNGTLEKEMKGAHKLATKLQKQLNKSESGLQKILSSRVKLDEEIKQLKLTCDQVADSTKKCEEAQQEKAEAQQRLVEVTEEKMQLTRDLSDARKQIMMLQNTPDVRMLIESLDRTPAPVSDRLDELSSKVDRLLSRAPAVDPTRQLDRLLSRVPAPDPTRKLDRIVQTVTQVSTSIGRMQKSLPLAVAAKMPIPPTAEAIRDALLPGMAKTSSSEVLTAKITELTAQISAMRERLTHGDAHASRAVIETVETRFASLSEQVARIPVVDGAQLAALAESVQAAAGVAEALPRPGEEFTARVESVLGGMKGDYVALKKAVDSISVHLGKMMGVAPSVPASAPMRAAHAGGYGSGYYARPPAPPHAPYPPSNGWH